jgi:hypothetical protein
MGGGACPNPPGPPGCWAIETCGISKNSNAALPVILFIKVIFIDFSFVQHRSIISPELESDELSIGDAN